MLDAVQVLDALRERGVSFKLYEHQAVDNAEAAAAVRARMAGVICKSLFLRGKVARYGWSRCLWTVERT